MRVLGLVPARGGSRRLPRKNLALLGGSTLVRRALETAVAAGCFEVVALSSDSDEILAESGELPVKLVHRPGELATDTARALDVVQHALRELEPTTFDAVGLIQCTSPFTAAEDFAGAVALLERTGAGSVVSVVKADSAVHPLKLKRLESDGRLLPYLEDDDMTPSHELPELWLRNGSIYLTLTRELHAGNLIAEDVRGYEMPAERSFDIDTPRDYAFAEFLLARGDAS